MNNKITGKEVKELRQRMGLSQTDFGLKLGSSVRTIQNWESSTESLSHIIAKKIRNLSDIYFNTLNTNLSNEEYLKQKIESDTLGVLEGISKDKILSYIQLKERDFQVIPSYVLFIKSQMKTLEARDIAKDL